MTRIEPTSLLTQGVETFLELTDTPDDFSGQARHLPRVNAAATGLEFLAQLADLEFGNGLNFLRVVDNAGVLSMEWADIQEIIAQLTNAVNRIVTPPDLVVTVPSIADVANQTSAAPSDANPSITVTAPSIANVATEASAAPSSATPSLTVTAPSIAAAANLV
jgi:hypothetical protein